VRGSGIGRKKTQRKSASRLIYAMLRLESNEQGPEHVKGKREKIQSSGHVLGGGGGGIINLIGGNRQRAGSSPEGGTKKRYRREDTEALEELFPLKRYQKKKLLPEVGLNLTRSSI